MNTKPYTKLNVYKTTLTKLRRIYGLTEVPMIQIVDRLVSQELDRISQEDTHYD